MRLRKFRWKDTSIVARLYVVVGVMAFLILSELGTLRFAMRTLSAVRAFVGGESIWSKAQKDAIQHIQRFANTGDEQDYQAFLYELQITEGDNVARVGLEAEVPDLEQIRSGFLQGHIAPEDVDGLIVLMRRFSWNSYLKRATEIWTRADSLIVQLKTAGQQLHMAVKSHDEKAIDNLIAEIKVINESLSKLEEDFGATLGDGSRWLEDTIFSLLFFVVLLVEAIGLTVTIRTARSLAGTLKELDTAAKRIGHGDFKTPVPVRSLNEVGRLAVSINAMRDLLERSYSDLERRVDERTRALAQLANENANLYQKAKGALKTRDEFLSVASHELKTPLTALSLQLQLLNKRAISSALTDEVLVKGFERCRRLMYTTTRLIDTLLDLTRIQLGKLEIIRETCNIGHIVRDTVAHFQVEAKRSNCPLYYHEEGNLVGEFDPLRVEQITSNLVSNAVKYGAGSPVDVYLIGRANKITLSVEDHGPGIPLETQHQIFERFARGDNDPNISGLGLGLYITRQIVHSHGGSIRVQSEPGKGSVFEVEFPLKQSLQL